MTSKISPESTDGRPEGSAFPISWFAEMVNALDRGDLGRAVEAQEELERDGFKVSYRRKRRRRGDT